MRAAGTTRSAQPAKAKTDRGSVLPWNRLRPLLAATLGLGLVSLALPSRAQNPTATKAPDQQEQLPMVLRSVRITQRLNAQLPLHARFVDDHGQPVLLGQYFNGKLPAILTTVYYNCPMLCPEEMDGLTSALEMVHLTPGKDFQVIVISFDPSETPQMAAAKKALYLRRYGRPDTAAGWHYLTGSPAAVKAVTQAIGFGYVRVPGPDGKPNQYAHASAIEVVTPQGRVAQYFLGVEFPPQALVDSLQDASRGKVGIGVPNILTYCYRYNPEIDKRSLMVVRAVQIGGIATVASLGGYLFIMFRRDIQLAHQQDLQPGSKAPGGMDKG